MQRSLVRNYDLHGVGVEIKCSTRRLDSLIHEHMERFSAAGRDKADATFELLEDSRDYLVPTAARPIVRYWTLKGYSFRDTYYFTDYLSYLIIEPGGRKVTGFVSEDTFIENGDRFFTNLLFQLTLLEVLRYFGLYPIHAAALVSPGGKGYLFPANGYSGKTSITLALLRRGFKYLSDDTVLLRLMPGGVEVLPFQKRFHIALDLLEEMPELGAFEAESQPFDPHPKRTFPAEKLFPGMEAEPIFNPEMIFFPMINGTPVSEIKPLSSREALAVLLPQSLEVMFNRDLAAGHLQALRSLLEHGRSFRLSSGMDIRNDPDRLLELLGGAESLSEAKE